MAVRGCCGGNGAWPGLGLHGVQCGGHVKKEKREL